MSLRHAAIAANRMGLGARPGELRFIAEDPRGWLDDQIGRPTPHTPQLANLGTTEEAVTAYAKTRGQKKDPDARKEMQMAQRDSFISEMALRCEVGATTNHPFRERIVRFWSNHFCVSTTRGEVRAVAGPYEREVIRPRVCGRFGALMLNAQRHPAMQLYLDNTRSVGPDSTVGRRSGRGLNENHAREILELHTLGVNGGYTQSDVEAFAQILTGWGVVKGRGEINGSFVFDPLRHQPGDKTLLGHTYREDGEEEGKDALRALAVHPSTARFVSIKLARHFIDDDPPMAAIAALEATFLKTEGDLRAVYRTLIDRPELWDSTLTKLKTPEELVLSTARALSYETEGRQMLRSINYLGQTPFSAPSPQGWPDLAMDWLGPEAILSRVEWAQKVASDAVNRVDDPADLADSLLGPTLSQRTAQAIQEAPTKSDALALLLASPEFQRR
jgi:uncharacterized protein (DUF1800 family)